MLKSLNIKIPLRIANKMDENGHLNPKYVGEFVAKHLDSAEGLDKPIEGLTFTYVFKIDGDLHTKVKIKATEYGLNMNDLVGRIIQQYYKG